MRRLSGTSKLWTKKKRTKKPEANSVKYVLWSSNSSVNPVPFFQTLKINIISSILSSSLSLSFKICFPWTIWQGLIRPEICTRVHCLFWHDFYVQMSFLMSTTLQSWIGYFLRCTSSCAFNRVPAGLLFAWYFFILKLLRSSLNCYVIYFLSKLFTLLSIWIKEVKTSFGHDWP